MVIPCFVQVNSWFCQAVRLVHLRCCWSTGNKIVNFIVPLVWLKVCFLFRVAAAPPHCMGNVNAWLTKFPRVKHNKEAVSQSLSGVRLVEAASKSRSADLFHTSSIICFRSHTHPEAAFGAQIVMQKVCLVQQTLEICFGRKKKRYRICDGQAEHMQFDMWAVAGAP